MDDLTEIQGRAEECAKLALSAPTVALREQYLELSKVWAELAKGYAERNSSRIIPPAPGSPKGDLS